MFQVRVVDMDPELEGRSREVVVKILADRLVETDSEVAAIMVSPAVCFRILMTTILTEYT